MNMTFAQLQPHLATGCAAARMGWNGASQFIWFVPPGEYPARMEVIRDHFPDNLVPYAGYYAMKNAQGQVTPWVPSNGDLQATDWHTVAVPKVRVVALSELQGTAQLQEFQSHKRVHAAKIRDIEYLDHTTVLIFADGRGRVSVGASYLNKHEPEAGGYYVEYEDGYQSYSPADAFELGYAPTKQDVFENETGTKVNLPEQAVDSRAPTDEYSRAQKRQHLVDQLTQLTGAQAHANAHTAGAMQKIIDQLIAELTSLV
ncbi:Thoeris anti-defense Tad2 family protein [Pantoea eucrina]|uniref:Thoeris anti-defense Tad2 family protein n=1 Tax=Pantoea eucrina TaxID=472693 RepID=UPI00080F4924|nr:MW1434 family type I TA system toxin [Pantoea eucrina]